jgi:hypothetical protein
VALPILATWLANAGNVSSIGVGGYEGVKAFREKNLTGIATVAMGLGVVALLSILETQRQRNGLSGAQAAVLASGQPLNPATGMSGTTRGTPALGAYDVTRARLLLSATGGGNVVPLHGGVQNVGAGRFRGGRVSGATALPNRFNP